MQRIDSGAQMSVFSFRRLRDGGAIITPTEVHPVLNAVIEAAQTVHTQYRQISEACAIDSKELDRAAGEMVRRCLQRKAAATSAAEIERK